MKQQDVGTGSAQGWSKESEDALRRVYGEQARFSRVGSFTLVHLDDPAPELVARREAEFDPNEFFFDDCPLCQCAKAEGGHIVFDGSGDREPVLDMGEPEEGGAARVFETALSRLANEAEAFGNEVDAYAPRSAMERYVEDVETLHERLAETLWSEESGRRVEVFERQLARALTTVSEVCRETPALVPAARPLERALESVAALWRSL